MNSFAKEFLSISFMCLALIELCILQIAKKAVGYEDGVEILHSTITITEFVESMHFEELLQKTSAVRNP